MPMAHACGKRIIMHGPTIYFAAASLDGFIADADHELGWLSQFDAAPGLKAHFDQFLEGVGAALMGARTYTFVRRALGDAPAHPGLPTWVVSHHEHPVAAGDDVRFVHGDLGPIHAAARAAAGERGVWLVGGGDLAAQMVRAGLVDELHVTFAPVLLGRGIPLLPLALRQPFERLGTTALGGGMVEVRYRLPRLAV